MTGHVWAVALSPLWHSSHSQPCKTEAAPELCTPLTTLKPYGFHFLSENALFHVISKRVKASNDNNIKKINIHRLETQKVINVIWREPINHKQGSLLNSVMSTIVFLKMFGFVWRVHCLQMLFALHRKMSYWVDSLCPNTYFTWDSSETSATQKCVWLYHLLSCISFLLNRSEGCLCDQGYSTIWLVILSPAWLISVP